MKDRLLKILEYKTGGKQTPFAKMLGWTPQYLKKLLNGVNFGLQPVITILSAFPEINARWLLLGDGEMLSSDIYTGIRQEVYSNIQDILEMEKYLPYMQPDECTNLNRLSSRATSLFSVPMWFPNGRNGQMSEKMI